MAALAAEPKLADARKLVGHPVGCIDCHDPKTIQLRVTRPGFSNGIAALDPQAIVTRTVKATSSAPTVHLTGRLAGVPVPAARTASADTGDGADSDGSASGSADATSVPIQGPGGAEAEGRMAWVGKVFAPKPAAKDDKDDAAKPARRPAAAGHARYLAGLDSLDELADPLRRQAAQVGMERAQQWVALSDCGSGIDDFLRVNFPRAVRIADFFHVAEHLGDLAKAWSPGDPDAAGALRGGWCHALKHEGGRTTLAMLEALEREGRSESALEVHRQVTQYLGNHADRMDYPAYIEAGWQIGSGHIEAACKSVVNERLKRSGMRWGEDGADAVCHLRALFKGDAEQWEAFWASAIN